MNRFVHIFITIAALFSLLKPFAFAQNKDDAFDAWVFKQNLALSRTITLGAGSKSFNRSSSQVKSLSAQNAQASYQLIKERSSQKKFTKKEIYDLLIRLNQTFNDGIYATSTQGFTETGGGLRSYGFRWHEINASPSEIAQTIKKGLNDLCAWIAVSLNDPTVDPIELAASLFNKLTYEIKPFHDGNGRVARAMVDFVLKHHGLPLPFYPASLEAYFSATESGNVDGFRKFLSESIQRSFSYKAKVEKWSERFNAFKEGDSFELIGGTRARLGKYIGQGGGKRVFLLQGNTPSRVIEFERNPLSDDLAGSLRTQPEAFQFLQRLGYNVPVVYLLDPEGFYSVREFVDGVVGWQFIEGYGKLTSQERRQAMRTLSDFLKKLSVDRPGITDLTINNIVFNKTYTSITIIDPGLVNQKAYRGMEGKMLLEDLVITNKKIPLSHAWEREAMLNEMLGTGIVQKALYPKTVSTRDGKFQKKNLDVERILTATRRENGAVRTSRFDGAESLLEMAGIDLSRQGEIVLFTLNPFLGDNIIYEYGRLNYLHHAYPNKVIKMMSPTSFIFRNETLSWLKPLVIEDLATIEFTRKFVSDFSILSRTIEAMLESALQPGSVLIWDDYTFDLVLKLLCNTISSEFGESVAQRLRPIAVEQLEKARLSMIQKVQSSESKGIGIHYSKGVTVVQPHAHHSKNTFGEKVEGLLDVYHFNLASGLRQKNRVYATSAYWTQLTFGKNAYLHWDRELLYYEADTIHQVQRLLQMNFESPEREYVVINLNTRGESKVVDLKNDYAERLSALLNEIEAIRPDMNIFVSSPEPQFGEEVSKKVNQLMLQKIKARSIAFLPADRSLWPPLIGNAVLVMSQDSGFYHLSEMVNKNVLLLGRDQWSSDVNGKKVTWKSPWKSWVKPGSKALGFKESTRKENGMVEVSQWMQDNICNMALSVQ